jgi:tetratricopeptide (TPR) repeat protein
MNDGESPRPISLAAHEFVLQGKHAFDRFRFDESLHYYQQAVLLEPQFAAAHEGMAGTYFVKALFDWSAAPDLIPKSREAALQAISLDSGSAGGYAVLGAIGLYFDRDWETAKRNLVRALDLNPNDARTRHAYADYLMVMGNLEESLRQVEIGRLYDPFSPMANSVVAFHKILTGRFDEVIDEIQRQMRERPAAATDLPNYREALWLAGRYEEAFEVYKQSWGRDAELLRAMELGYQAAGYRGAIRYLADALAERDPPFKDSVTVAKLYARADEPEKALLWLEKAHQHREPQVLHVEAMPAFWSLRADPRYQELLHKIGFPADR